MVTNARGQTVIAPTGEPVTRARINALLDGVNDVRPVANATARAQLVTDLTAAGLGPSSTRPLVVARADAYIGQRLEYTDNGTTWTPVNQSRYVGATNRTTAGPVMTGTDAGMFSGASGVVGMRYLKGTFSGLMNTSAANALGRVRLVTSGGIEIASGQIQLAGTGGPGQQTLTFEGFAEVPAGSVTVDVRGQMVTGTGMSIVNAKVILEEFSL